jgi:hypothetical protein
MEALLGGADDKFDLRKTLDSKNAVILSGGEPMIYFPH